MRALECDADRRVEIYNAIVEMQAAQSGLATAFSEMQHRFGVSRDEFSAALKCYYRIAGLIFACSDEASAATTEAFSEAEDVFDAYVQGEALREH